MQGDIVIVSRHSGFIAWLRKKLGDELVDKATILETATAEDIHGKVVFGNLPLSLAAEAREVWTVDFKSPVRGGQDLTVEEMEAAGAELSGYLVYGLE